MNTLTYRAPRKFYCPAKTAKKIIMTLVVMGGSFFSYAALASCTVTSGSPEFNLPSVQFPPLDPRTPINGVLATITTYADNTAGLFSADCTAVKSTRLKTDFINIGGELYSTELSGIAMRIKIGDPSSWAYVPNSISGVNNTNYTIYSVPTEIELIRTGDFMEAGLIPAKVLATGYSPTNEDFIAFNVNMLAPLTITILQPTCSAITPNMNINLGTVNIADFNAQGRTTPKDFTIDLNCTGVAGTTGVHVTLTDANNPANLTTQLNLSPDSGAQGIAFEVHNKFGIVSFGPDLSGTGNPGQWLDGAAGVGSYSIPLSVNYVRLPGPIKGGTANSGVTYTLNYD